MATIKKIDYYCGAFLSYLVSNDIAPTLFEADEDSKTFRYLIGSQDYKVYVKYAGKGTTVKKFDKVSKKWVINFSKQEYDKFKDFYDPHRKLLVVCVCTNAKFSETDFAVLTYEDALKCLGSDDINKQRHLTIVHQKASPKMYCHGTAVSDENAIEIFHDYSKYFSKKTQ